MRKKYRGGGGGGGSLVGSVQEYYRLALCLPQLPFCLEAYATKPCPYIFSSLAMLKENLGSSRLT